MVERFEMRGLAVVSLIRSSQDDWDAYSSVHTQNLLDWVRDHRDHEDREDVRRWRRKHAAELATRDMGWAIVCGRKTVHV